VARLVHGAETAAHPGLEMCCTSDSVAWLTGWGCRYGATLHGPAMINRCLPRILVISGVESVVGRRASCQLRLSRSRRETVNLPPLPQRPQDLVFI
jgi:hypothetical protein